MMHMIATDSIVESRPVNMKAIARILSCVIVRDIILPLLVIDMKRATNLGPFKDMYEMKI